ncbi:ketopantoate reductase family protein [Microbulbifer epialgicus]|uniref:Ketopantoate reductase family protein n=1 Tax=Microbulbifer epialgicus TaxID=393907 RepID=A0ABV4P312_9GAMM
MNDGFNLIGNQLTYIKGKGFFIEEDRNTLKLYSIFEGAGIEVRKIHNMNLQRAQKTIYNCSTNIFSAIYLKTFRELFEDEKLTERIKHTFFETYKILSKKVDLRQDKEILWDKFYKVVKNMNHYSSTYQDIRANKITEIAFLNGQIVKLGQEMNIATPYNCRAIKEFREKYPTLY